MGTSRLIAAAAVMTLSMLGGCESCLKRVPSDTAVAVPYPECDGRPPPAEGDVLVERVLVSGPTMREKGVVERYRFERRNCVYVGTMRQDWPLGTTEAEVVFDLDWRPLRAWKRMTLPGAEDSQMAADVRAYDLRSDPPHMRRQRGREPLEHYWFRGEPPVAVVGPGRGLLSAWIKAADLQVAELTRGPVLDFRELVEKVDTVALRRETDKREPSLGGIIERYTVFGRETVFTDDQGFVVGDLFGLRTAESVGKVPPPPVEIGDPPDPVHTP